MSTKVSIRKVADYKEWTCWGSTDSALTSAMVLQFRGFDRSLVHGDDSMFTLVILLQALLAAQPRYVMAPSYAQWIPPASPQFYPKQLTRTYLASASQHVLYLKKCSFVTDWLSSKHSRRASAGALCGSASYSLTSINAIDGWKASYYHHQLSINSTIICRWARHCG